MVYRIVRSDSIKKFLCDLGAFAVHFAKMVV